MTRVASLLAALALAACATAPTPDPFPDAQRTDTRPLETLTGFLTGTYQSIPQAVGTGDSSRVTLRIVRVWPERAGEFWFYEEFEVTGQEGGPFLQRLVRIGMAGSGMLMVEYGLPGDASRFAGAWRDPARAFAGVDPRTLREVPNCRQDVASQNLIIYAGGTIGQACRARVPAGAYAVSDFSLTTSSLRTWDRGYDASGKVVWGNPAGPLDLRRVSTTAK
jgi:hypothetical protein